MTTTTASYTVSVLVNDEVEDPTFREFDSWSKAEQVAEDYVANAQGRGWYLAEYASMSWKLTDDDGDRIHVLIEQSADPFAGIVDVKSNDGWDA